MRESHDLLLTRVGAFAEAAAVGLVTPNIYGPPDPPFLDVDFLKPEAIRPFHNALHDRIVVMQVAVVWRQGVGEDPALDMVDRLLVAFPVNTYIGPFLVYKHHVASGYDDDNMWRIPVHIHLRQIA